jgi:hypothetical protein
MHLIFTCVVSGGPRPAPNVVGAMRRWYLATARRFALNDALISFCSDLPSKRE